MTPLDLYQSRLDTVSAATLAGDVQAYMACIDFPYLLRTIRAEFVLATPAELEPTFWTVHRTLKANGVTHYERVARTAHMTRPDRIEGQHFTHMISNGERIVAPHPAWQALVRRGDSWLFSEASYPLDTADWPLTTACILGDKASRMPEPGLTPQQTA